MPTQYIIYPNPTSNSTVTGTVRIEDSSGNPLNSTSGALDVSIAGGTGSSDVNLNGLTNFQTTQYTVGTSAVQLTPTALNNRSSMSIKVTTTSSLDAIYIGNSSAVTTSTGYALFSGDSFQLDLTPAHQVWVIGTSSGQIVYVLEIGD